MPAWRPRPPCAAKTPSSLSDGRRQRPAAWLSPCPARTRASTRRTGPCRSRPGRRPATRCNVAQGWGHFLAWLARNGQLATSEGPRQRVTLERLAGFVEGLRARGNTARTVHMRVEAISLFLGAAAPGAGPDRGGGAPPRQAGAAAEQP